MQLQCPPVQLLLFPEGLITINKQFTIFRSSFFGGLSFNHQHHSALPAPLCRAPQSGTCLHCLHCTGIAAAASQCPTGIFFHSTPFSPPKGLMALPSFRHVFSLRVWCTFTCFSQPSPFQRSCHKLAPHVWYMNRAVCDYNCNFGGSSFDQSALFRLFCAKKAMCSFADCFKNSNEGRKVIIRDEDFQ